MQSSSVFTNSSKQDRIWLVDKFENLCDYKVQCRIFAIVWLASSINVLHIMHENMKMVF